MWCVRFVDLVLLFTNHHRNISTCSVIVQVLFIVEAKVYVGDARAICRGTAEEEQPEELAFHLYEARQSS